jgi:hypothetical protein
LEEIVVIYNLDLLKELKHGGRVTDSFNFVISLTAQKVLLLWGMGIRYGHY